MVIWYVPFWIWPLYSFLRCHDILALSIMGTFAYLSIWMLLLELVEWYEPSWLFSISSQHQINKLHNFITLCWHFWHALLCFGRHLKKNMLMWSKWSGLDYGIIRNHSVLMTNMVGINQMVWFIEGFMEKPFWSLMERFLILRKYIFVQCYHEAKQ